MKNYAKWSSIRPVNREKINVIVKPVWIHFNEAKNIFLLKLGSGNPLELTSRPWLLINILHRHSIWIILKVYELFCPVLLSVFAAVWCIVSLKHDSCGCGFQTHNNTGCLLHCKTFKSQCHLIYSSQHKRNRHTHSNLTSWAPLWELLKCDLIYLKVFFSNSSVSSTWCGRPFFFFCLWHLPLELSVSVSDRVNEMATQRPATRSTVLYLC